jgi:hypothetical protein
MVEKKKKRRLIALSIACKVGCEGEKKREE